MAVSRMRPNGCSAALNHDWPNREASRARSTSCATIAAAASVVAIAGIADVWKSMTPVQPSIAIEARCAAPSKELS